MKELHYFLLFFSFNLLIINKHNITIYLNEIIHLSIYKIIYTYSSLNTKT